ncbi:MAG: hypothetical protein CFE29_01295 [Bradyrhizobiaceae bacterium PARB1]|jgi:hypothetical protein|nr:MAG: hypothetical protein CFE29_01295 [Bradyrhizobiaceae bacterium PARB1]
MLALQSLDLSRDDRLWRLRAWLLERAIFVMTGELRWMLLAFGCRLISASLAQARLWLVSITRC